MRIESLSIKAVTISIFLMIGLVAVVLSLFAGSYFRQAALAAQMNSLSRVIEVATEEMFREVRAHTFDLGMHIGYSRELVATLNSLDQPDAQAHLIALLDDPFINGFVGFSNINLEKIRIFDTDLQLIAESSRGTQNLPAQLAGPITEQMNQRYGVERLKAIDALWLSSTQPLFSTLVPVGGLRLRAYVEIVIDPAMNLPQIGKILETPVSIFSALGDPLHEGEIENTTDYLPVKYTLQTFDARPAFRIVGHENVQRLNQEMEQTQMVTTTGFLLLTLVVLLLALWLFNRFLFVPVGRMMRDMQQLAEGKLDLKVDKTGLREFYILAESFNAMADQVRLRTNELHDSQSRLLHLLDLDDSAILCFGVGHDVVYFNRGASQLFGYSRDDMHDLEFADLFRDESAAILDGPLHGPGQRRQLSCISRDGKVFVSDAIINPLSVMGETGYAVVLKSTVGKFTGTSNQVSSDHACDKPDMNTVEQSLRRILEIAQNHPGLLSGDDCGLMNSTDESCGEKIHLREQVVNVMTSALSCWEHELGKNKLDLAEQSRIWPVYIDKSTPTTRTLDKYLHIDSCPKNPRCQRVIDTAEFVLKQLGDGSSSCRQRLLDSLVSLRQAQSGIRSDSH